MSDFDKRYDQIEAYLKGKLPEAEKAQFEVELASDSELREEVEVQKVSRSLMEQVYLKDISNIIKEQSNQKPSYWKWIATGLAGFITVSSLLYLNQPKSTISVVEIQKDTLIFKPTEAVIQKQESTIVKTQEAAIPDVQLEKQLQEPVVEVQDIENSIFKEDKVVLKFDSIQKTKETSVASKTEELKSNKKVVDPVVVCKQPKLNPIKTVDCHLNETDGELILDQSKGLKYQINNAEFLSAVETQGLPSGKYLVRAKDENDCIYDLGVHFIQKGNCLKETNYSFNTAYNDVIELAIKEVSTTEITILNKLGQTVFTNRLDNVSIFEWDGKYSDGREATLGIHKVIVKQNQNTCLYNVIISK